MSLILFTGGARSGKSDGAEALALQYAEKNKRVTCAVFGNPSSDDGEFQERIRLHQEKRPSVFETLECYGDEHWIERVPEDAVLVLDCLGTALTSLMNIEQVWEPDHEGAAGLERTFQLLTEALIARNGDCIIVTNEVGAGLVPPYESGRWFRDLLGRANRRITDCADEAYYCVCGRFIDLAALPTSIELND